MEKDCFVLYLLYNSIRVMFFSDRMNATAFESPIVDPSRPPQGDNILNIARSSKGLSTRQRSNCLMTPRLALYALNSTLSKVLSFCTISHSLCLVKENVKL